ncbi:MAG: zinc dependent phospholipase C family protein, partial [Candidatus Rifleibacteriota bacterium]
EAFQNRFSRQKKSFLKGSTDPDMLIKDFTNHIYYLDGTQTGGMYRITDLFNRAVELLRSGESDEKTAYVMGLMSHYIADLNQPLHSAGKERDPYEDAYHSRYEGDINHSLRNFNLVCGNERLITSIEERVMEMVGAANRHYDEIGMSYRAATDLNPLMEMTGRQLNASLQNIVDFWATALYSANFNASNQQTAQTPASEDWNVQGKPEKEADSINVNSASAVDMAAFFRISEEKAQRLVDGRPFKSAYDLAKTGVFNPMYIKRNKDRIRIK